PSIRILDVAAKQHADLKAHALKLLDEEPRAAETSAVLDWLVARAKVKELAGIGSLLVAERPRSAHLSTSASLLASALTRDRTGALFRLLLRQTSDQPQRLAHLTSAICSNPK